MAKGDGHAAKNLLDDLEKNHPDYFAGKDDTFKAQFKELKDGANSLAEDNDIDKKSWWNPTKYIDKAWKFCKDNAKWIAFGCAAAIRASASKYAELNLYALLKQQYTGAAFGNPRFLRCGDSAIGRTRSFDWYECGSWTSVSL